MNPQYSPIIADLHCDTVLLMKQGYDISVRNTGGHVDIPRLKNAGVNLQCFACFVDPEIAAGSRAACVDELIDILATEFTKHSDDIAICRTESEARQIITEGRIAAFLAIENDDLPPKFWSSLRVVSWLVEHRP